MAYTYLEFEKPISELENKIESWEITYVLTIIFFTDSQG